MKPTSLSRDAFVARFGGVFEHSPWIAEGAFDAGLSPDADTADGLHARLCAVLEQADREAKLALIKAHPDLAGRLALAKELTSDSTAEQASAGLDRLLPEELARFTQLNDAYQAKFGFPFVMAIRGRGRAEILEAFTRRLEQAPDVEEAEALRQIEQIAHLRLREMLP